MTHVSPVIDPSTRSSRRELIGQMSRVATGGMVVLTGLRMDHLSVLAQDASPAAETGLDLYPEVAYVGEEYAFSGPAEFPAGLTRITLQNDGQMNHHGMLVKLNEGKSIADLATAFEQGLPGLFTLGTSIGGPGPISPGQRSTVIHDVAVGNYILMCIIPDADGIPHVAKGMALPIIVTSGTSTATAPTAEGTIELMDFHFTGLPASIPHGQHLWEVKNTGQQLHELLICRIAPGFTYDQVEAILLAPPATPEAAMASMDASTPTTDEPTAPTSEPFHEIGGLAPANPGAQGWVVLDLDAGDYFAICFIPDPASGAPHFALGMIQPLTVT